jgi:hypothetical protein
MLNRLRLQLGQMKQRLSVISWRGRSSLGNSFDRLGREVTLLNTGAIKIYRDVISLDFRYRANVRVADPADTLANLEITVHVSS